MHGLVVELLCISIGMPIRKSTPFRNGDKGGEQVSQKSNIPDLVWALLTGIAVCKVKGGGTS